VRTAATPNRTKGNKPATTAASTYLLTPETKPVPRNGAAPYTYSHDD
jgi:hypothetical protein